MADSRAWVGMRLPWYYGREWRRAMLLRRPHTRLTVGYVFTCAVSVGADCPAGGPGLYQCRLRHGRECQALLWCYDATTTGFACACCLPLSPSFW